MDTRRISLDTIRKVLERRNLTDSDKRDICLDAVLQIIFSESSAYEEFQTVHKFSIQQVNYFWEEIARSNLIMEPVQSTQNRMWNDQAFSDVSVCGGIDLQLMPDVRINACYNLLDRHIRNGLEEKNAIYFVNSNQEIREISYGTLKKEVCKMANVLEGESIHVREGDRVLIYLPDCPYLIYCILACFRVGAVPAVVFRETDREERLKQLIDEGEPSIIITTHIIPYPGNSNSFAAAVLNILQQDLDASDKNMIIIDCFGDNGQTGTPGAQNDEVPEQHLGGSRLESVAMGCRVFSYDVLSKEVEEDHKCVKTFKADHPLFLAFTSGSTGYPKVVEHGTLGYLLNVIAVFKYMHLFQLNGFPSATIKQDVSFCLPSLAWLYGMHSLLIGPLLLGGTTVLYDHKAPESRVRRNIMVENIRAIISKCGVTHLFTVPHFVLEFIRNASSRKVQCQLSSLRYVATAGSLVTKSVRRKIKGFFQWMNIDYADTWAQTESGSCLFTTPPAHFGLKDNKMIPFFGVDATVLLDGYEMDSTCQSLGRLVIRMPWPGLFTRLVQNSESSCHMAKMFPEKSGVFHTGDRAKRHPDGTFVIKGREDKGHVAVIGSEEYQSSVLQLEQLDELLEEDDAIEEAIVCCWCENSKAVVVPGLMAIVGTHRLGFGDDEGILEETGNRLDDILTKKAGIKSQCRYRVLSCLAMSEDISGLRSFQGKKDRQRVNKAAQEAANIWSKGKGTSQSRTGENETTERVRTHLKTVLCLDAKSFLVKVFRN